MRDIDGCLLTAEHHPARIDDAVIAELKSRERADGLIPGETARRRRYRAGSLIVVRHGVLSGLTGTIQCLNAHDRIPVLFSLFNQEVRVVIPEPDLSLPP